MSIFDHPERVATNGIELAVYEAGAGDPVILLHGFPELAYSWRHQMPALADAGFRAIAPDQRGYGMSDRPGDVEAYAIEELVADVDGLLEALGLERSRFVAHDWGAIVMWQYALRHPERVQSMAILNIPFYPRPPVDPIGIFRQRFGDDFYIVNFQDSHEADECFASNPRKFLGNLMRRDQLSREQWDALPKEQRVLSLLRVARSDARSGVALLEDRELDYFVDAFERSGFTGGINWYRNMTHNWETSAGIEQIVQPRTLFIGAHDDLVIPLADIDKMRDYVPDLEIEMLAPCGHWSQQERPGQVNRLLIDFFTAER